MSLPETFPLFFPDKVELVFHIFEFVVSKFYIHQWLMESAD